MTRRGFMTVFQGSFPFAEPRLIRRDSGGWLAMSDAALPIAICTTGLTADDARLSFETAFGAWRDLLAGTVGVPEKGGFDT